jgi:4-hydroxy-tetrahydrodipicolinate synthase
MATKVTRVKSKIPHFGGSLVALVTPFKNGELDETKLRSLIDWHIQKGTHGIVPCGTTGESATLSHEEHERVIEITVEQVNGRVPVIAGSGSNSTKEAIRLTKFAQKAGADAALLINPYYNKPTQDGLYHHFKAVAEACDIPQFVYNIPSRTAVNVMPETMAKLSEIKNIIGVKEATGNLVQATEMISLCRKGFIVLSGEDALNVPLLLIGASGSISVLTNIIPDKMSQMMEDWFDGKVDKARDFHYKYLRLIQALFLETNPTPVKTAMAMMGMIDQDVRLPLFKMTEANRKKLNQVLKEYKLVK